jgi:hypothetical protein
MLTDPEYSTIAAEINTIRELIGSATSHLQALEESVDRLRGGGRGAPPLPPACAAWLGGSSNSETILDSLELPDPKAESAVPAPVAESAVPAPVRRALAAGPIGDTRTPTPVVTGVVVSPSRVHPARPWYDELPRVPLPAGGPFWVATAARPQEPPGEPGIYKKYQTFARAVCSASTFQPLPFVYSRTFEWADGAWGRRVKDRSEAHELWYTERTDTPIYFSQ